MAAYTIQSGDTLSAVAIKFYGSSALTLKLANFNGITDPDHIFVGKVLQIPARADLEKPKLIVPAVSTGLAVPNGLNEIIATFGNIFDFIRADGSLDPKWENILGTAKMPFALPLSWAPKQKVTSFPCHTKLSGILTDVFTAIADEGLAGSVKSYGGCYNYRAKRGSSKISAHAWGIALDLNPDTNDLGTKGDMDPRIVAVFKRFGFKWGGEFTGRKDPMHFQYCTGY